MLFKEKMIAAGGVLLFAVVALVMILAIIAVIIYGPLITIWALNTLFGLTIAFTFKTWFATLWLSFLLGAGRYSLRKKSGNDDD